MPAADGSALPGARPVRVAVAGAGRTRYGTGPFVSRRLVEFGADVVAVSTTSPATAEAAAADVRAHSGRPCRPFASVAAMLGAVRPDAIAICSPAHAHLAHLRAALEHGVHTFCEKPLVDLASGHAGAAEAAEIVAGFAAGGLVLHLNTQWRYALRHLESLYDLEVLPELRTLRVELQPPLRGAGMVGEAVPHANSILLALAPNGAARNLSAALPDERDQLAVHFTWREISSGSGNPQDADVAYHLQWRPDQPRHAAFEVNGMRVERTVDISRDYQIVFSGNGRSVVGTDPLADSVRAFLDATRTRPLPSSAILRNLELMVEIAGELETPPAVAPAPLRAGLVGQAG